MDKLRIHRLRVPTIIGDLPKERHWPQGLFIDIEIATDTAVIAHCDELNAAYDYVAVRQTVVDFMAQTSFQLIETLAAKLADHLQATYSLSHLILEITKQPAELTDIEGVSIVVERTAKA